MSTNIAFHNLNPSVQVSRFHHDGTDNVPEFWSATITITDDKGHRQTVPLYSNVGPIVFDDPDAPAPIEDETEVGPIPRSVEAFEAALLAGHPSVNRADLFGTDYCIMGPVGEPCFRPHPCPVHDDVPTPDETTVARVAAVIGTWTGQQAAKSGKTWGPWPAAKALAEAGLLASGTVSSVPALESPDHLDLGDGLTSRPYVLPMSGWSAMQRDIALSEARSRRIASEWDTPDDHGDPVHDDLGTYQDGEGATLGVIADRLTELGDTLAKQKANRQRTYLPGLTGSPIVSRESYDRTRADEARGWDEAGEVKS